MILGEAQAVGVCVIAVAEADDGEKLVRLGQFARGFPKAVLRLKGKLLRAAVDPRGLDADLRALWQRHGIADALHG